MSPVIVLRSVYKGYRPSSCGIKGRGRNMTKIATNTKMRRQADWSTGTHRQKHLDTLTEVLEFSRTEDKHFRIGIERSYWVMKFYFCFRPLPGEKMLRFIWMSLLQQSVGQCVCLLQEKARKSGGRSLPDLFLSVTCNYLSWSTHSSHLQSSDYFSLSLDLFFPACVSSCA